jgi:hypothetical protein
LGLGWNCFSEEALKALGAMCLAEKALAFLDAMEMFFFLKYYEGIQNEGVLFFKKMEKS